MTGQERQCCHRCRATSIYSFHKDLIFGWKEERCRGGRGHWGFIVFLLLQVTMAMDSNFNTISVAYEKCSREKIILECWTSNWRCGFWSQCCPCLAGWSRWSPFPSLTHTFFFSKMRGGNEIISVGFPALKFWSCYILDKSENSKNTFKNSTRNTASVKNGSHSLKSSTSFQNEVINLYIQCEKKISRFAMYKMSIQKFRIFSKN